MSENEVQSIFFSGDEIVSTEGKLIHKSGVAVDGILTLFKKDSGEYVASRIHVSSEGDYVEPDFKVYNNKKELEHSLKKFFGDTDSTKNLYDKLKEKGFDITPDYLKDINADTIQF